MTNVPDEYKISIETAYKTAEFEESAEIKSAFCYRSKQDKVLFNPSCDSFSGYSYPQALTHELSHRIDAIDYHSENNVQFSKAIEDAYPIAMRNKERLSDYSFNEDNDGFVSDIISAISQGKIDTAAYHSEKYWAKKSSKEKEIFANLFSLGVFDQKKHTDLIMTLFPDVYSAFENMRKEV